MAENLTHPNKDLLLFFYGWSPGVLGLYGGTRKRLQRADGTGAIVAASSWNSSRVLPRMECANSCYNELMGQIHDGSRFVPGMDPVRAWLQGVGHLLCLGFRV